MKKVIPIFYTIDEGYAPLAAVSIRSLVENASKDYDYVIFLVHEGRLSRNTREKISQIAEDAGGAAAVDNVDEHFVRQHVKICFRSMTRSFEVIPKSYLLNMKYFTPTIYFRLFLGEMYPEFDKVIYLDADTVVLGDIAKLFEMDLGEKMVGAVADPTMPGVPVLARYAKKVLGLSEGEYVNSGVLLLDTKRLREADFVEHFLRILKKYRFDTIAPDQDYLNAILSEQIFWLPAEWNVMPTMGPNAIAAKTGVLKPQIIHYNLFNKPWHYKGVQHEKYFWNYAEKSGFFEQIKAENEAFLEEDRLAEVKSLQQMLRYAKEIIEGDGKKFCDVDEVKL